MLELIIEYRDEAQRLFSVILAIAMWRWGGAPERATALVFVGFFTIPIFIMGFFAEGSLVFGNRAELYIATDIFACLAFIAIALNANRNYPLWIAGFQVVALAAHMVRGIVDSVSPLAYAILVIGPSYFQLIIMVAGLLRHIQREKKFGEYRDWRVPLPSLFKKKQVPEGLKGQM